MAITVEIEGMEALLAQYGNIERGLLDFRQLGAWKGVQIEFYKIVGEVFKSEGSSNKGGKWAALSPAYAKVKEKRYGKMPILQASEALYKSLTSSGATGSVYNETAQELEIGTSIKYAEYHQSDEPRKTKLPQRKILAFTDAQEKQLMKPIQEKLKQLVQNARLRGLRGF